MGQSPNPIEELLKTGRDMLNGQGLFGRSTLLVLGALSVAGCGGDTPAKGAITTQDPPGRMAPTVPGILGSLPFELGVGTLDELVSAAAEGAPVLHSRIVVNGEPGAGTIHVIGMLHSDDRVARPYKDMFDRSLVAEYQAAIWRQLEEQQPRVILLEGAQTNGEYPQLNPQNEAMFRALFPAGKPPAAGELSGEQVDVLALYPAAIMAYRLKHPEVSVVGVDDGAVLDRVISGSVTDPDSVTYLRYEFRERLFMKAAAEAARNNPDEAVVLVAGTGHRFNESQLPDGQPVPQVIQSAFPSLLLCDPDIMLVTTTQLASSPAQQKMFVKNSLAIPAEVFGVLDEGMQRLVIKEKEFLLHGDIDSRTKLEHSLVKLARTSAVKDELRTSRVRIYAEEATESASR